jgi:hypothetical protein
VSASVRPLLSPVEHVEASRLLAERLAVFVYGSAEFKNGRPLRYGAQTIKKLPGWRRFQETWIDDEVVRVCLPVCFALY